MDRVERLYKKESDAADSFLEILNYFSYLYLPTFINMLIRSCDNPASAALRGRTKYFGRHTIHDGVIDGLLPISDIRLPGCYNAENVMTAMTAVRGPYLSTAY